MGIPNDPATRKEWMNKYTPEQKLTLINALGKTGGASAGKKVRISKSPPEAIISN